MRVYIPGTFTQLEDLISNHQFPARGGTAFALTPALREAYAVGDTEELEHVAFLDAARASLRLLSIEAPELTGNSDEAEGSHPAADDRVDSSQPAVGSVAGTDGMLHASGGLNDPLSHMRRVVISVDIPDSDVTLRPDLDVSVVKLKNPIIPESAVAAVHVDLPDAEKAVARAAALVDAADLGDEDAELAVGDAEDHDLAWYDPVELRFLVELSHPE